MNYPLTIVACLTLLAFFAHIFGGLRESLSIAPAKLAEKKTLHNFESLDRNWVQSICAFQLVSIDLLALSCLLFILSFTDIFIQKQLMAFCLAGFYFFWGVAWIVQLIALKRSAKDYLYLGHWVFWFGCSALIYWGALSL